MEIRRGIGLGLLLLGGWVAACGSGQNEKIELGAVSNEKELVQVGRKIFFGKGQCALCHTIGGEGRGKCPDLEGAGARLTREFIHETLTNPEAYIKLNFDETEPKKFPARMPTINKPPIGLTDQEILSVISFVQSQGGTVTVRPAELEGQKSAS